MPATGVRSWLSSVELTLAQRHLQTHGASDWNPPAVACGPPAPGLPPPAFVALGLLAPVNVATVASLALCQNASRLPLRKVAPSAMAAVAGGDVLLEPGSLQSAGGTNVKQHWA